jgi:hypothetical protein
VCFVINDTDYGPLVEEYEAIFQENRVNTHTTYSPSQRTNVTKKLARYFGVPHSDISQEVREETRMNIKTLVVIRIKLLEKHGGEEDTWNSN